MSGPLVKGWCPGAHRPMLSGDGLVVRVRPFRGQLDRDQAIRLCALAARFGNGTLDLTSRANLQIRGVAEANHAALLVELDALGLIDADPAIEGHRNILMSPDWAEGDLTDRLHAALLATLPALPDLPEKMGFAIDTGQGAHLAAGSADFRFEMTETGALILRADGAARGRIVTEDMAMVALLDLARWFLDTGGLVSGRMARHLKTKALPDIWAQAPHRRDSRALTVGAAPGGSVLGVPFGKIDAVDLTALMLTSGARHLRLMPGRRLWLRGAQVTLAPGFLTEPGSPLLDTHACPGAPFCPRATVETRSLAARLAHAAPGVLHVSGCAKGCAYPRAAAITLVGRAGRFDLVENGAPWDEPRLTGLDPDRLSDLKAF